MMMDRRTVLKLGVAAVAPSLVAACVSNGGIEFHRNTRRPISSTTRFDAARFAGDWVIRG